MTTTHAIAPIAPLDDATHVKARELITTSWEALQPLLKDYRDSAAALAAIDAEDDLLAESADAISPRLTHLAEMFERGYRRELDVIDAVAVIDEIIRLGNAVSGWSIRCREARLARTKGDA